MSNQKLFIGISGKMGTGKSTISHMLQSILEKSGIMSLAAPLYKAQDLLYGEYELTLKGAKDRDLLIAIGQWGRDIDPNFWLEQFVRQATLSDYDIILCDDIRFPNEADFFAKHGVLVRLEGEQRGDNVDHSRATDATEVSLDDYDFKHVISNKGDPASICQQIANIMLGK